MLSDHENRLLAHILFLGLASSLYLLTRGNLKPLTHQHVQCNFKRAIYNKKLSPAFIFVKFAVIVKIFQKYHMIKMWHSVCCNSVIINNHIISTLS